MLGKAHTCTCTYSYMYVLYKHFACTCMYYADVLNNLHVWACHWHCGLRNQRLSKFPCSLCVTISHRMRSRNTQKITPPFWFWISDNVVCVLILADRWATFFIHLNQTTTLSAKLAWLSHGWIQKAQFSSVEFKVDSQPMFHTKSRMCPQDHLQNRVV